MTNTNIKATTYTSDHPEILKVFMAEHGSSVKQKLDLFESCHSARNSINVQFFRAKAPGQVPELIGENDCYSKVVSFNFSDQMLNSHNSQLCLLVTLE